MNCIGLGHEEVMAFKKIRRSGEALKNQSIDAETGITQLTKCVLSRV
jgi:hypothetical protein